MPRTKRNRKKRKSSCPKGWVPAGTTVPVRLTKRQASYCQRAFGIARFCYNLAVATRQSCRTNRLCQPHQP
ncbi:MAG: helix-turn-helix domain-containing protein [Chloroflexi bacterium]|nr:helix-turn-helix domain-containing protein [Chloroflexota bacterium]